MTTDDLQAFHLVLMRRLPAPTPRQQAERDRYFTNGGFAVGLLFGAAITVSLDWQATVVFAVLFFVVALIRYGFTYLRYLQRER